MSNTYTNNSNETDYDYDHDLDEDEYEVEKILKHRTTFQKKKQVFEYYIKWKGFDDHWNTWEPEYLVTANELVEEYWANRNRKKPETTNNALKRSKRIMDEDEHKTKGQVSELDSKLTALEKPRTVFNSSVGSMAKKTRVKNKPSSLHQTVATLNKNGTKTNETSRCETARRKDDDDETLSTITTTYGNIESILLDSPEKRRSPLSTPTPTQPATSSARTAINMKYDDDDIVMVISPSSSPSSSLSPQKQRQYQDGIADWSDENNELDEVIFDLDFRTELSWNWKEDVRTVEAVTREGPILYGVVRWNDNTLAMYPTDLIRRRCGQKLIDFYEKKLEFGHQIG